MNRTETLNAAVEATTNRDVQYGTPEDSFDMIAQLWSAYIGEFISASDVAVMMVLLKIAREQNQHKDDNAVDIAGYAACLNELYDEKEKTNV